MIILNEKSLIPKMRNSDSIIIKIELLFENMIKSYYFQNQLFLLDRLRGEYHRVVCSLHQEAAILHGVY